MNNKRFIYLVILAFVAGALLLLYIQRNSSRNMDQLITGNEKLLKELRTGNQLRELERDIIWIESRIRAAIATDDTSHIAGVDDKMKEMELYIDSLKVENEDDSAELFIDRLGYLAGQKLQAKNKLMHEFFKTGRMDDTSMIANPRAREISNEISAVTRKIYDSRQKIMTNLSTSIRESSRKARTWNLILISMTLLMAGGILWFIINRMKKQQVLIQELDRSEKKVRETARIKENFMTNMSHEIRTPLNSILGFTNLLKTKKLDKNAGEFVGSIQKAGENLLTIINDILDLSKIEAGMVRIELNPFSVRGLMHSIEMLFSERVKAKGLVLTSEIDANVPDTLIGDATRLTQVLVNLIGNALKFTENGSIAIGIFSKSNDGHHIELGFSVTDTGIGIEDGKLASIFDRFQQAEDSITRKYGGTGLGLSIVKDLVLLQGGSITVESQPGKGTRFHFFIPYAIATWQAPVPAPIDISQLRMTGSSAAKILVVDDNEMNRSLMHHLLQEWQLSFDIAGNGREAIELLKENKYKLVLMDIQMPEMDGYTATRVIRNELQMNIPIIAMTAHALAGERERCLSQGMNEYISKPINEQELYGLISRFAGLKKPLVDASVASDATASIGSSVEAVTIADMQTEAQADAFINTPLPYQYIDLTYMMAISKGNKAYEQKVTKQFINNVPKELQLLSDAYALQDMRQVNQIAHNLKTTVSIMGLTEILLPMLDTLEYATIANDDAVVAMTTLQEITQYALQEAAHFLQQV